MEPLDLSIEKEQEQTKQVHKRISYGDIAKLSLPIMIGSAVQNLITLMDSIFLGRVGQTEFAAIGLVGVFYLMITSIGYSFSKAGQILIARRAGEGDWGAIGVNTYSMWAFALGVATLLFSGMFFVGEWAFGLVVNSPEILKACSEYLYYRAPGVFLSYSGVVIMALYTGVARTNIILYNSVALGISNFLLNYALIFGHWGLPAMGMGGAALASTLSELIAFLVFLGYMLWDKENRHYGLFVWPKIDVALIKTQLRIATPIIVQSAVGMGSWFVFFLLVEDMGQEPLAISNLLRVVYLLLMIPAWGFASGLNTLVSNLMGRNHSRAIRPIIWKTTKLCLLVTFLLAAVLVIFPEFVLQIGTTDSKIIEGATGLIPVFLVVLASFCLGSMYFNGLIGTGATQQALYIQLSCVALYLIYIYVVIRWLKAGLVLAWSAEIFYWLVVLVISLWYLYKGKWHSLKV